MVLPVAGETGWADKLNAHIQGISTPLAGLRGLPGRIRSGRTDQGVTIGEYSFTPIAVDREITVTGITTDFYNLTGTGGVLHAALYQRTGNASIGNLAYVLGDIPVSNADVSVVVNVPVNAGNYYVVTHYDGQGTLTAVSNRRPHYFGIISTTSTQSKYVLSKTAEVWPGAWPTTLVGVSATTASIGSGALNVDPCPLILEWS